MVKNERKNFTYTNLNLFFPIRYKELEIVTGDFFQEKDRKQIFVVFGFLRNPM